MNGRVWLKYFIYGCKAIEDQSDCQGEQWTEFMGKVLDIVGEKMNCYVARSRLSSKKQDSHEYMDIDAFFIDNRDYDLLSDDEDPLTLPSAIVELENSYDNDKIAYCLWKLACIRSPIRVLICYQKGREAISSLVRHLEKVIRQNSLLKDDTSDTILIIGDGTKGEGYEWADYFSFYEWRNETFALLEGVDQM